MDIVLALVAALLFALGTVLQQRAGLEEPAGGSSSGLLLRMAKRPVWLAGIVADAFGFVAQAAALASTRSGGVALWTVRGAELRSSRPASPSSR